MDKEETKINTTEDKVARKIIAEGRGRYLIFDENKAYDFNFPLQNSIAQNYDIISYLQNEIWNAMEKQKKQEEEKKIQEKENTEKENTEKKDS